MFDKAMMRRIGALAATQARIVAADTKTTANEVIDLVPLLKKWRPGVWAAGEVVAFDGKPYKVNAPGHDSTNNPTWNPQDFPALFSPYHATDKEHALPWQAPTGVQDAYMAGEWMIFTDGVFYRCKVNGTVHPPDVLPEAWELN